MTMSVPLHFSHAEGQTIYGLTSVVLERGLDRIEVFKARCFPIYVPIRNKSTTKNEASQIESLDVPE
jgi:hypothetical protein